MDDSIFKRLCSVALTDHDRGCIAVEDRDISEGLLEYELSVLIHLPSGQDINFAGFKSAIGRSWRCGSFSLQRVDETFYQVFFGTSDTVNFVLENGPWWIFAQLAYVM